jgi:hypothetical protein
VDEAGEAAQHRGGAGLTQGSRVLLALVAQRIERGGDHVGGGETGQVLAQQRRGAGIACVGPLGAQVVVLEPVHFGVGQQEALAEELA